MTASPETHAPRRPADDRYKWTALANTTAAVFMSALDCSIVLIALPAIFRGVHLDPLAASLLRGTSPTAKPLAPRTATIGDTLATSTDDGTEALYGEKGHIRLDPGN
ncbi:hypothetical protein ACIHCX_10430 [Streptomyces sp. NPDC052043]|uniref:hypothetical protein n=1 Tax=Streptomyces sp. NPDC052043 TaxID=3365684 RepID=UPI0037D05407